MDVREDFVSPRVNGKNIAGGFAADAVKNFWSGLMPTPSGSRVTGTNVKTFPVAASQNGSPQSFVFVGDEPLHPFLALAIDQSGGRVLRRGKVCLPPNRS